MATMAIRLVETRFLDSNMAKYNRIRNALAVFRSSFIIDDTVNIGAADLPVPN